MNSPTIDDLGMLAALKSQTEQAEWYPDFVNMLGHEPTVQDYMMMARQLPEEYKHMPVGKEWYGDVPEGQKAPPPPSETLSERILNPLIRVFRSYNKGYYEGKVPEDLK